MGFIKKKNTFDDDSMQMLLSIVNSELLKLNIYRFNGRVFMKILRLNDDDQYVQLTKKSIGITVASEMSIRLLYAMDIQFHNMVLYENDRMQILLNNYNGMELVLNTINTIGGVENSYPFKLEMKVNINGKNRVINKHILKAISDALVR